MAWILKLAVKAAWIFRPGEVRFLWKFSKTLNFYLKNMPSWD